MISWWTWLWWSSCKDHVDHNYDQDRHGGNDNDDEFKDDGDDDNDDWSTHKWHAFALFFSVQRVLEDYLQSILEAGWGVTAEKCTSRQSTAKASKSRDRVLTIHSQESWVARECAALDRNELNGAHSDVTMKSVLTLSLRRSKSTFSHPLKEKWHRRDL